MTLILCKKHGTQGFVEVCEHIDSELRSDVFHKHKQLTFWCNVYACDDCWQKFDIANFENHPELTGRYFYDDEYDENGSAFQGYNKIYSRLNRKSWCTKCLREIQDKMIEKNNIL